MTNIKLPPLDSRTILNVAEENFERVGLKAFAVRLMYTGEHTLTKDEIRKHITKSVNFVNAGYTDIPINGILLVYDSYFVHILEGSEDTLFRQIRFLFNIEKQWIEDMKRQDEEEAAAAAAAAEAAAEEALAERGGVPLPPPPEEENPPPPPEKIDRVMFRRVKMLMVYHSFSTLMFDNWKWIYGKPPSLVGTLDLFAPISDHMEQLKVCIDKLALLCKLSREDENLCFDGLSANDPKIEALPEVALLDYLLASPHILDLREVSSYHRRVDDHIFYFECVWPLPTAFTPRHLYKLKIDDSFVDPLPVMDWEIREKEEEAERMREMEVDFQKSSSDSD